jgi:hypothetical protein
MSMVGCFGKFALTRKLYEFTADFGKPLDTIIMWCMFIVPIYEIAGFVDIAILNLVEFWTGSNPLAMNEGETETRMLAHEGRTYEVVTTKNRYDITELENVTNSFAVVYDDIENAWFLHNNDQVIKMTEEVKGEINFFNLDGEIAMVMPN